MFELCFDCSFQLRGGIVKPRRAPWERFKIFENFQSLEAEVGKRV